MLRFDGFEDVKDTKILERDVKDVEDVDRDVRDGWLRISGTSTAPWSGLWGSSCDC